LLPTITDAMESVVEPPGVPTLPKVVVIIRTHNGP